MIRDLSWFCTGPYSRAILGFYPDDYTNPNTLKKEIPSIACELAKRLNSDPFYDFIDYYSPDRTFRRIAKLDQNNEGVVVALGFAWALNSDNPLDRDGLPILDVDGFGLAESKDNISEDSLCSLLRVFVGRDGSLRALIRSLE